MTLTSLIPTLRHSLPDPWARASWPASAERTLDDVVIDGRSMAATARSAGTPYLERVGSAPIVLVTRVFARVDGFDRRIDCALEAGPQPAVDWAEVRLIGRISSAPSVEVHLAPSDWSDSVAVRLPSDLGVGDLLIAPFVAR